MRREKGRMPVISEWKLALRGKSSCDEESESFDLMT